MRIGFVELVLLLFIASITVGPNVALFVDRWLRRAQRTSAAAARRKAQLEAQAAIEREALMTRFRVASNIFALLMLAALAYGLLLRPIDTPPKAYTAPDVRQDTGAAQTALSADSKDGWKPGGYLGVDCVRTQDGLVYAAAYNSAAMKKRQSDLVRTDGGHTAAILSVEGELTGFAFDADGDLWLTVVTPSGGALCRARHDSWGTSVEQVVTQIDGAPLGVLSAVETGPDGKVYFAVSTEAAAKNGLESALRTELIAHTGTGCVYVYDPSARTVEQVLGGVAGAAGLALSEDGRTLYVSDLGNRCIWSVDADARELTAGGKNCGSFVSGLPGYPGALALDEDGILYISYRWTRSGWLEKHADSTLLRGIALRYFNPIGSHPSALIGELPRGVPQNLVPYVTQTAAGIRECLSIFGNDYPTPDGTCIRDYIDIVDLARAHVAALHRLIEERGATPYEVFNVGTGRGVSVLELVRGFERANGLKLNYRFAPRRAGDITAIWADPTLANTELGWTAERTLDQTLAAAWA